MSGPIVRKYGFPNFENIFGKRELQHGTGEAAEPSTTAPESPAGETAPAEKPTAPGATAEKKP